MEAIINISNSLSLTIGLLKFNVAGELKFNDASKSWHDDVILVILVFILIFVKRLIQRIHLNHYMRFNLNDLKILEHKNHVQRT